MPVLFVPTLQDPALSARTFSNNPTLTAALNRIRAQQQPEPTPAPVISGIETEGSDAADPFVDLDPLSADSDRPTEQELNEVFLVVNRWQLVSRGDAPCDSVWLDALTGDRYFFDQALTLQEGRDLTNGSSFTD